MKKLIILFIISFFLFGCKKNKQYKRSNDLILFGSYPITLETNKNVIKELNEKTSKKIWSSYDYYIDGNLSNYMFYYDITLKNDKYRGIYFTKYRPYNTAYTNVDSETYIDDNNFNINETYWFKYETIKWNILEENDDEIKLISSYVIDSIDYYNEALEEKFNHNNGNGYANNYELSNIRKWLNSKFYNLAFNEKENSIIKIMEVDNKTKEIDEATDTYTSNNTFDKVTLLSYIEANNYYQELDERKAFATDYSLIQGVFAYNGNANYRLRSASSFSPINSYYIDYDGAIHGDGMVTKCLVSDTSTGIRPVITLKK